MFRNFYFFMFRSNLYNLSYAVRKHRKTRLSIGVTIQLFVGHLFFTMSAAWCLHLLLHATFAALLSRKEFGWYKLCEWYREIKYHLFTINKSKLVCNHTLSPRSLNLFIWEYTQKVNKNMYMVQFPVCIRLQCLTVNTFQCKCTA